MSENEYRIGVLERIVEELIFTVTRLQERIPSRIGLTNITAEDVEEIRQEVKEKLQNIQSPVCSDPARGVYEHEEDCPVAALDDLERMDK